MVLFFNCAIRTTLSGPDIVTAQTRYSVFISPDGTEVWNAYHATAIEGGACDFTRTTRAQKVNWKLDGTPEFGVPVKTAEILSGPSGEVEQPVSATLENGIYK